MIDSRKALLGGIFLVAGAAVVAQLGRAASSSYAPQTPAAVRQRVAAAPGVVEPSGKEREISAQVVGVIKEFKVEENQPVHAGEVIAEIDNTEQTARLASAEAALTLRQSELERLLHGARPEEVREATSALNEADAALEFAQQEYNRRTQLAHRGVSPQAVLDQAKTNFQSATARRASVAERLAQIKNGARSEDVEAARAHVKLAEAELALAKAMLEKTYIRSPITGMLLRRMREVGETVGSMPPTVVAIVGDLRGLEVRAEVDETDVGKVKVGQRVEVVSDAFPGKTFYGKVRWVSLRMGPKNVSTGRSADRLDTKILQVLIDLEDGTKLPVGLRVDAYLYGKPAEAAAR